MLVFVLQQLVSKSQGGFSSSLGSKVLFFSFFYIALNTLAVQVHYGYRSLPIVRRCRADRWKGAETGAITFTINYLLVYFCFHIFRRFRRIWSFDLRIRYLCTHQQ